MFRVVRRPRVRIGASGRLKDTGSGGRVRRTLGARGSTASSRETVAKRLVPQAGGLSVHAFVSFEDLDGGLVPENLLTSRVQ